MRIRLFFYTISLCTLFFLVYKPISASSDEKAISISISNDEPLLAERILSVAFERLGYHSIIDNLSTRTAVTSTNDGEYNILAAQVAGIENDFTNLIPVPVPISSVKMVVYTRPDFNKSLRTWEDLSGLKVCYNQQSVYLHNRIPDNVSQKIIKYSYDNVYQTLLDGSADIAIIPIPDMREPDIRDGIVEYCTLETLKTYTYVNKNTKKFVNLLANEYTRMEQDGTMQQIKENKYLKNSSEKTVLHISSYSTDMIWERDLVTGIMESLNKAENILYYNFPLNLKRKTDKTSQYELMNTQIRKTFLKESPDVIIVSDDDAFNYLMLSYRKFFTGIPVVFCGISDFSESRLSVFNNCITGVTEILSANDTVENMLSLYPDTQNIFIVNDYSIDGIQWRRFFEENLSSFSNRVNIVYNENLSLEEIAEQAKNIGKNTVVLCGNFYHDQSGTFYTRNQVISVLDSINDRPVFTLTSVSIGKGLLGGKVIVPTVHGTKTGEMVLHLLNGTPISEIPILNSPDTINRWIFDYDIAEKYNLNTKLFPDDHVAINKKPSFFESHPMIATITVTGAIAAFIIIIILLIFLELQRISKRKIKHMALHDDLTKLGNRFYFIQEMERLLAHGKSGGALLFDLDGFKEINDVYGHENGDLCIIEITNRLNKLSAHYDILTRAGGDEFFVISLQEQDTCMDLAKKILSVLSKPIEIANNSFIITASIGVVMFPIHADNIKSILQNADLALYKAKASGKNQSILYNSSLSASASHQANVLKILRSAIPKKEVFLLYQPIVDIVDDKPVSFEALMRIESEAYGFLPPNEFIPFAESSQLIIPLGLWVLKTACELVKKLLAADKHFSHVSVNVSVIQLQRENFVQEVIKVIESIGVDPHYIQLEITESVFINNSNENIQKLLALHDFGTKIALDDFGTGYSSMKNLVNLPIDTLKIDKSLIDEIEHNDKKRTIAKLIIDAAHSLNMTVIAEGVETKEQRDFLKTIDCDLIQGYYYSRPLNPVMLEDFLI